MEIIVIFLTRIFIMYVTQKSAHNMRHFVLENHC